MLTCGWSHDVSSNVPALTQSIVGIAATSENTGDPHLEQNLRHTGRPAFSDVLVCVRLRSFHDERAFWYCDED